MGSFFLPIVIIVLFTGSSFALLFQSKLQPAAENRRCNPNDRSWQAYPKDPTRYLLCDVTKRTYTARQCPLLHGFRQNFDVTKKQCVKPDDISDFKFNTPPVSEQRVGDACFINQDCAEGMYCNSGICACFLNYIEVNMKCVRVSTICATSHFYAEMHSGKPRTCTSDIHCPVNFACELHQSAWSISFCCYRPPVVVAQDVCEQNRTVDSTVPTEEVLCSPEFAHCPQNQYCRYNGQIRRHYCCPVPMESTSTALPTSTVLPTSSATPSSTVMSTTTAQLSTTESQKNVGSFFASNVSSVSGIEKVLGQTIALAELVCGAGLAPWVFEGFPMPCNPLPPGVCPPSFICKSVNGTKLHFCCNERTKPLTSTPSSSTTPSSETVLNATQPEPICGASFPFMLQDQPLICIGSDPQSCPVGFLCQIHASKNVSFCCASSAQSTVPSTSVTGTAYVTGTIETTSSTPIFENKEATLKIGKHPAHEISLCGPHSEPLMIGNTIVMCVKDEKDSCPQGFGCRMSQKSNAFYCCSNETSQQSSSTSTATSEPLSSIASTTTTAHPAEDHEGCPQNMYPARDPMGRVLMCTTVDASRPCPIDYHCTYSIAKIRYQCCGAHPVPTVAPTSSVTSGPSTSSAAPTASSGHAWLHASGSTVAAAPEDELCPAGQRAFRDKSSNATKYCMVNAPGNCPSGYYCQFSSVTSRFLCCGVHAGCPSSSVAYINPNTGSVQACKLEDINYCPTGYHCANTQNNQKVCCSGEPTLCSHGHPLVEAGKTRMCSLAHLCPADHSCMPSRLGSICCPRKLPGDERRRQHA